MSAERERAIRERAYAIWEREGHPADRSLLHRLWTEIGPECIVGVMDEWQAGQVFAAQRT